MAENTSESNSTSMDIEINLSVYTQLTNATIGLLTIICNGSLLLCLFYRRKTLSIVFWYQLVCLCTSDMLAGLAPLSLILSMISAINTNTAACKFILMFFYICQLAALINVSHLSARRLYVVGMRRNFIQRKYTGSVIVGMSVLSWVVSCSSILPFMSLMTNQPYVNGCLSPRMFKDEEAVAMALKYVVVVQCTPVVFLNIAYSIVIGSMRMKNVNQIHPLPGGTDNVTRPSQRPANIFHSTVFNDQITSLPSTSSGQRHHGYIRKNISSRHNVQMEALRHLMIVLCVVNCTTWPFFILNILISTGNVSYVLFSEFPTIDIQLLSLNSLLNPLIYAITIRDVRKACKETAELVLAKLW